MKLSRANVDVAHDYEAMVIECAHQQELLNLKTELQASLESTTAAQGGGQPHHQPAAAAAASSVPAPHDLALHLYPAERRRDAEETTKEGAAAMVPTQPVAATPTPSCPVDDIFQLLGATQTNADQLRLDDVALATTGRVSRKRPRDDMPPVTGAGDSVSGGGDDSSAQNSDETSDDQQEDDDGYRDIVDIFTERALERDRPSQSRRGPQKRRRRGRQRATSK